MKSIWVIVFTISNMLNTSAQTMDSTNTASFELQYLVRQPKRVVEHPPVLFLFHGAGSNEHDLFSFANQISDEWLVVSARAPYQVSGSQFRWYDVKMIDHKIIINLAQAEESRKTILKFVDEVVAFYHADRHRVVLAGFSQGANMASIVSLTAPEKVSGFAVFSGRFMDEIKPLISTSASLKSVKCFLAHGSKDYLLPITYAKENIQMLQSLGISVTYSEDTVAHSISPNQIKNFIQWLKQF